MSLSIRPYAEQDRGEVVELWRRVFGYTETRNQPDYVLDEKLAQDDGLLLVARRGEGVVGTAMGGYDGHRGWLYSVAVEPRLRRGGIGRALVAAMEQALLEKGAPKINLQIRAGNDAVIGFYQALGWSLEPHKSMGKVTGGVAAARAGDLPAVVALVAQASLPTDGLERCLPSLRVAREEGVVVGAVAVEPLGEAGLLRSLCVAPAARGRGLGAALLRDAEALATARGVRTLYLLTETADAFFERAGYAALSRAELPRAVARTPLAASLCPESARALCRRLP